MTKNLPALILAALAALVITSTYSNPTITVLDSGDHGEQVISIPVTRSSLDRDVVYSVPVGDLTSGHTLLMQTEFETTNDLGYNVMVASYVILADSPTATQGLEIAEANTYNVTPDMHHGITTKIGSLAITENLADQYVNVIVYSRASRASTSSTLRVEPDYGRLVVTVISNG